MADGRMGPVLETVWQMAVEIPLLSLQIAGKVLLLRLDGRWQERSNYLGLMMDSKKKSSY
jgi:hypothetical protein